MKKRLLSFAMLGLALQAFSQSNLKTVITGDNSTTKHFTRLLQNQQVVFNANQVTKILGLSDQSALVLKSTLTDNLGMTHYRFYQTYMGIPVNRSMYVVSVKDGKIVALSGSIITDFSADMSSRNVVKIDGKQAIANALSQVNAGTYVWQIPAMEKNLKDITKNSSASYYPVAEKCWYYAGDQLDAQHLKLAYKIDVFAEEPFSRAYYFVDASTGKILGREERIESSDATGTANTLYSGSQTIHSEQTGANAYRLHDLSRGNGVITLHGDNGQHGNDYTSTSSNFSYSLPDQNALDAHWGVEMTYDFYKAVFNRNSIDNNGYALNSYVNRGGILYNNNASWDGTSMNYGKRTNAGADNGKGVTGIDVTGHELTHGVTQNTSALVYSNESGAMNESMSDIMGKNVQFWAKPGDIDWRLSNDMNWFIRDMSNPNAFSQPDTYHGTFWATGSGDNGGVHTNSGVGNFMYYLLVNGGSGTNDIGNAYTVQGIGVPEAEQILYRTETVYLTTNSQYADWRTACINAATDLFGASSNEVNQVKNAWFAVGVGSNGTTNYCASAGLSTANEYIKTVAFGSIDNVSGNNGGYGDFTALSTNVTAGQTVSIQVQAGFTGATRKEAWTVYIDYNGDKDFNDAGETLGPVTATSTGLLTKTFKIPATAKNGATRMRVQMHYNTGVTDPCATFDFGEVEDYTVVISGGSGVSSNTNDLISGVSVSPNPVISSVARLNYTLAKAGNITFTLTDANGVQKGVYKAGNQNQGSNTYVLNNLSSLHNGYYYIAVQQDGMVIGKINLLVAH
jgi:Zn-dependent metalloprotease